MIYRYNRPNVNVDPVAYQNWQWEINHGKRPQDDPLPIKEDKVDTFNIIETRDEIVRQYCKEKKWDFDDLSIEQILEIRQLPEWVNASKESK